MRKLKLVTLLLVFVFALAACTSTSPALTSVMVENMKLNQASYEAQSTFKLKTNILELLDDEFVPEEVVVLLNVLEEGFVLDMKQQDLENAYIKFGLNNAKPLQDAGLWPADKAPELELYALDGGEKVYFKTSTEDQFFYLDAADEYAYVQPNINEMNNVILDAVSDYLKQYDLKLRDVKNKGKVQVTTPGGTQTANHIQVNLNLKDIKDFISYTLGNLAEYDKLDTFVQTYYNMILQAYPVEDPDFTLTEEELAQAVKEIKAELLMAKQELDKIDLDAEIEELGFKPELKLELNFYVSDKAELIKDEMKLGLSVTELSSSETFELQMEAANLYWNTKGNVKLPAFDQQNAYNLNLMIEQNDVEEFEKINEDSVLRSLIESAVFPRTGSFKIGSTEAEINDEYVTLKTAPYSENGVMLVPVSALADILYTEAEWNGKTKEVTLEHAGNKVVAQIGSKTAYVNGQAIEMEVAPAIKNGEAFVPLRFVSENLGAELFWSPIVKKIYVYF